MNIGETEKKLVEQIKKYFEIQNKSKVVLGLSGGIDSAVTIYLLVKALGKNNVIALLMPNSKITKDSSTIDAENLAKELGVKYFVVAIDSIINSFEKLPWEQSNIAKANLNARIRALILYNYANSFDALVSGTGNKTEFYLGYFTKHGDAAADFSPIVGLLKKEVIELAKLLSLPKEFLEKPPSAELWENQEDEKELGLKYELIDELLPLILEEKTIPPGKEEAAKKIRELINKSKHKRELAKAFTLF